MNKIYSDQMQKAVMLSQGIQKNAELIQQRGININTEKILLTCKALEEIAIKQDEAEKRLKEVRDNAHIILNELKELYNEAKQPIKLNFQPEEWGKFGLPDKR